MTHVANMHVGERMFSAWIALFLSSIWLAPLPAASSGHRVEAVWKEMVQVSREKTYGVREKVGRLGALHAELPVSRDSLHDMGADDVRAVFLASDMLTSYMLIAGEVGTEASVLDMAVAFAELQRRGTTEAADARAMLDAWVAIRRLDKAAELKAATATLADVVIPGIRVDPAVSNDEPAAIEVESSAAGVARPVQMSLPLRIVIVSGCHISDQAISVIDQDPALRNAFATGNAVWLVPADKNNDFEEIAAWNRQFPRQNLSVSYRNDAWKGIDFSRIPSFYFYRDGQLVASHQGWTKGSVPLEIVGALKEMGLLDAAGEKSVMSRHSGFAAGGRPTSPAL